MVVDFKKLDKVRYINGFSICQLAEKSGVSKATLSRAIKGTTILRPQTIFKVARALNTPVEDLLIQEYSVQNN